MAYNLSAPQVWGWPPLSSRDTSHRLTVRQQFNLNYDTSMLTAFRRSPLRLQATPCKSRTFPQGVKIILIKLKSDKT